MEDRELFFEKLFEYNQVKNRLLQGRGGDVNTVRETGWGILHWASSVRDLKFVMWLVLYLGASVHQLTVDWNNVIAYTGDFRILKFLLWQGCDPDHGNIRCPPHDHIFYLRNEPRRRKILRMIHQGPIHKDLWREVAEWWEEE